MGYSGIKLKSAQQSLHRSAPHRSSAFEYHRGAPGERVVGLNPMKRVVQEKRGWLLIVMATFMLSCHEPDFAPEYAIASVQLSTGQKIYFKREVRGITGNYDVIAISTNADPCKSYDKKNDACICTFTENVYYKLKEDTLHLYGSTATSLPEKTLLPVKIENHEIQPLDREKFKKNYAQQGITQLALKTTSTNKCR